MDEREALRAERDSLRRQLDEFRDYLPDALLEAELATRRVTYMNRMASLLLGYSQADVATGLDSFDLLDAAGQELVADILARHLQPVFDSGTAYQRTGRQDLFEVDILRKDGVFLPVETQGSYVLDADGRPHRIRFVFRDISERRANEAALRRSEAQLRQFAASAPVILFAIDAAGTLTMLEGRGLGVAGLDKTRLIGKSIAHFREVQPALVQFAETALEGGPTTSRVEIRERVFDVAAERSLDQEGRVTGLVGVATDVTGLARAEQALVQAQKMESLGLLAGGIAHDFNNVLTTVLGVAGMLKRAPDLGEASREQLTVIEMAARRGADITGRLLTFARGGLSEVVRFDLQDVISDAVRLAQPSLPANVTVDVRVPLVPVTLTGDSSQFTQAVLNMLINARDALPAGGRIGIALSVANGTATLVIEDDGTGMDEETQLRLFEPFFTTKPPGTGTGLGMSITYSVVQVHNGTISVRSAPGKGTKLAIRIPVEARPAPGTPGGARPTILVVDDDALVRRATAAVLDHLGFDAIEAPDGGQAIALVERDGARFVAVILDIVMPGLSGHETFDRLRAIPGCPPVFLCSGYAAESQVPPDAREATAGILRKPFTPDGMAELLERAGITGARG
ncbi:MAG: PAS domain S-box protein [Dehalococcoidia bacterium]|nr:PAS domain S-box protein [Dehalococcoidia bacterium]